jgi:hypothetical protein
MSEEDNSRSVSRLRQLDFDPIGRQVELYRKLDEEEKYLCQLRDGNPIFLDADGKRIRYSAQHHSTVLGTLQKIANDLMRYGYGRVSETINVQTQKPAKVIINLTPHDYEEDLDYLESQKYTLALEDQERVISDE